MILHGPHCNRAVQILACSEMEIASVHRHLTAGFLEFRSEYMKHKMNYWIKALKVLSDSDSSVPSNGSQVEALFIDPAATTPKKDELRGLGQTRNF